MPTISMFYGILIRMYYEDHNPPHIHAIYGDQQACCNFDGEAFKGELPKKQDKLVQAWIEIHKDDLEAIAASRQELQAGETVSHNAINWD